MQLLIAGMIGLDAIALALYLWAIHRVRSAWLEKRGQEMPERGLFLQPDRSVSLVRDGRVVATSFPPTFPQAQEWAWQEGNGWYLAILYPTLRKWLKRTNNLLLGHSATQRLHRAIYGWLEGNQFRWSAPSGKGKLPF